MMSIMGKGNSRMSMRGMSGPMKGRKPRGSKPKGRGMLGRKPMGKGPMARGPMGKKSHGGMM